MDESGKAAALGVLEQKIAKGVEKEFFQPSLFFSFPLCSK